MATLEKPKQKKTKKSSSTLKIEARQNKEPNVVQETSEIKPKETIENDNTVLEQSGSTVSTDYDNSFEAVDKNEILPETSYEGTLDQQKTELLPQEKDKKDIITLEKEDLKTNQEEIKTTLDISKVCDKIENIEIAPSAPVFEIQENKSQSATYPVLPTQETSQISKKIENKIVNLKPFTREQLAQLYNNSELAASIEFENCFVQSELRPGALSKHPLHELISNYALSKEKLKNNRTELERLRKELKSSEESAWIIENAISTGHGQCGDSQNVSATHRFQTCKLQKSALEEICRLQTQIYRLANENHLSCSYNVSSLKIKVEYYLECAIHGSRSELRACISVLFRWARIQGAVSEEARNWLGGVICALLGGADWHDHAYILCHVLRCPAGVAQWAAPYIQVPLPQNPPDPFNDPSINHAVTVLGMLLRGVAARRDFLAPPTKNDQTTNWVLVDSDGEEDENAPFCLRENDLVSFLNQIPLGELLTKILSLNDLGLQLDEHKILRLFAFCRVLIELLNEGLETFGGAGTRYQQFCKRLCRLIGHILRFACDAFEISILKFPNREFNLPNLEIQNRLQIELDSLFLVSSKYLHSAEKLGSWQFLAVLPFEALTDQALWQFLKILQTGTENDEFPENLEDLQPIFEERVSRLSVEASYYLLNTYANIASTVNNLKVVKFTTLRLLETGFVYESTKDFCAKPAASLLRSTCLRKPQLLSMVIKEAGAKLARIGPLAAQLFRELPLNEWYPNFEDDIPQITNWLLQEPTSLESCLARLILSELNWGSLPPQMHDVVALILVEQVVKYGETQWAWQLVHKLRLHAVDRGGDARIVPELSQIEALHRGVKNGIPLCNFLALLMTQHGHLVPMICTHGITQLQILAQSGNIEAVCIAIGYILPLFADCAPDTLANSQAFQGVIQTVLNADRTYVKMAKNLVPGGFEPGKFTHLLASAIEYNMLSSHWRNLLIIWLNIFLAQPQWSKDQPILFLLDTIVRISFFDEEAYRSVLNVFKVLLQKRCDDQENNGIGLLSWVSGSYSWPPILIGHSNQAVWISYVCLHAEFDILECKTKIWYELLNQLRLQTGRTNVDSCLKKACNILKFPNFSSSNLCIYRWAQLALETSLNHPVLPCLWQNFFHLFLERSLENIQPACVGSKFFDGVINTTFCKKLKKRLQETAQNCTDERRSKVYLAFSLWLDEPLIQDGSLYLPSLPQQYETGYLTLVLEQRAGERPWIELCDASSVREGRKSISGNWGVVLGRDTPKVTQTTPTRSQCQTSELPLARIKRRLSEYDKPLPPPTLQRNSCPVPELNLYDLRCLTNDIRRNLKQLSQHAELYALQRSEHQVLDQQFRDLLPHLYKMCSSTITINKTCGSQCSSSAAIHIRFTEARANDSVRNQLQTNKTNSQSLFSRSNQPISDSIISNCASIERAAINLHNNPNLAAELFFLLIELYEDSLEIFPPTRNLFKTCCQILGPFASTREFSARLCNTILSTKSTLVAKITSEHFKPPGDIPVGDFLQIYSNLMEKIGGSDDFCEILLARLDIVSFLHGNGGRTKLVDRSKLIELIFKGLFSKGKRNKIQDLLRVHLVNVFGHDFPEHYGEIIQLALINSGSNGGISNLIWRDLILNLVRPMELQFMEKGPLISDAQLRQAVAQQKMLRQDVLVDTCVLLGRYFSEERKKHGVTYGLYPRYRACVNELAAFCSIVSHALVWTVVCGTGAPADRLVECTYAKLVEMYGPWLLPIQTGNTIAQPWLRDDSQLAQLMISSLISCICFMLDAMPASRGALCQTWQLYCGFYARTGVHEHILRDIHFTLERLPWKRHWPSVQDLETMARLITGQQLPLCHRFTCHIFLCVDWTLWLTRLEQGSPENLLRALNCLLQLLIRLPSECEDLNLGCQLLETAQKWHWLIFSPSEFSNACDWCITTLDPRCVLLCDDPQDDLKLDRAVLNLLNIIASYEIFPEGISHQTLALKRQCFLRCCVKLLVNCAGKHKQLISQNPQLIARTLTHHLDLVERLCDQNCDEGCLVLSELFQIINCQNLCESCLLCMEAWFSTRKFDSKSLICAWRTIFLIVTNPESSSRIFEVMLTNYFSENNDWRLVSSNLRLGNPTQPPLEVHLASSGRLLTLNAIILRKLGDSPQNDRLGFLETLIELSNEVRLGENVEPKLPLLYSNILKTITTLSNSSDTPKLASAMRKWASQLATRAESKPGAFRSVLGALTGSNKPLLSPQGRLLNRALAAFVLAQLPVSADIRFGFMAPCHVGSTGGNQECSKVLLKMDANLPDDLKYLAEDVLKKIQSPENSMHNCLDFFYDLVDKIYCKPYLNKNM